MGPEVGKKSAGFGWPATLAALIVAALFVAVTWGYRWFWPQRIGPEQPIPFSHRVHVEVKEIGCLLCHDQAADSAVAGIPPVETCMLCHSRIIVTHPQVQKVREHWFEGRPILWEQVYDLPDFVFFNHSVHLHRSVDCSRCHGNVAQMDRIELSQPLTMGFCVECHRRYEATIDCFTCHR